jgi:type IV pilus assembly protein PilC
VLTYKFTARNPVDGKRVSSEVQAQDEKSAAQAITAQGLAPLEITPIVASSAPGRSFLNRVRTKDKVIFSRQLSTLINAGLPLVQSLRTVDKQTTSKPLRAIIQKIVADVEAGSAFSVALGKFPATFNRVYVSLIAAGETSGTLDKALERLADQQEKDAEILAKVRGAMTYPAIVLLVMLGVLGFMLVKVLPQVQEIYKGLPGVKLPFITQLLLSVSHFVIHFWWVVIILLIIATFVTTRWARTGPGKLVIDRLKMRAWPIGPLFMKLYMARFARTGTTLVASGVPLLQMLSITSEAVDNVHISKSIDSAAEKVKGGKALSETLVGDPNFLELVPNMIRIGEQSGALETMLGKTADYYEKEVDNEIKAISTIIEPVLMVIMGVMALIIVAAILLPIYGLVGKNIIR